MPAIFPRWTNNIPIAIGLLAPLVGAGAIFAIWYWFSPKYTDVGYRPEQPVPYSHKLHAGEMGLDCRYCHNTVEYAAVAAIPPTQTCMNCHDGLVQTTNPSGVYEGRIENLKKSWETGEAIEWVRVHMLPDYAYFNHAAHVNPRSESTAAIGCESCHGRIDQQIVVQQQEPLSMGWCLDCHREPELHLRPKSEVTTMGYEAPGGDQVAAGTKLKADNNINPPLHCSGCHR